MICGRYLSYLLFTIVFMQPVQAQDLIVGETPCLDVVRALHLPVDIKEDSSLPPGTEWLSVDQTLAALKSGLQGSQCRLKFRQIFEDGAVDFFPLTSRVLAEVPEDALTGVELWGPSGEKLGTFVGRSTIDEEIGPRHRIYTFYGPMYRDRNNRLVSLENYLLQGQLLVRWDDLRERIAITTWSADSNGTAGR